MTFQEFVDQVLTARYDGKKAYLAKALGITPSAFGRSVATGTLGVESLLRLAQVSGSSPRRVLELAGKRDIADLLDAVYGDPTDAMDEIDRQLLALNAEQKRAALTLTRGHSPARTTGPPREAAPVRRARTGSRG